MKDKKQYLQKLKNRCDIHQILSLTEVCATRENKFFVRNIDQQYQSHYHIHMNIEKMTNYPHKFKHLHNHATSSDDEETSKENLNDFYQQQ